MVCMFPISILILLKSLCYGFETRNQCFFFNGNLDHPHPHPTPTRRFTTLLSAALKRVIHSSHQVRLSLPWYLITQEPSLPYLIFMRKENIPVIIKYVANYCMTRPQNNTLNTGDVCKYSLNELAYLEVTRKRITLAHQLFRKQYSKEKPHMSNSILYY